MRTILIILATLASVALLLGIVGVFGSEFILLSCLIALATGIVVIPSALGLVKKEENNYYSSGH